MKNRNLIKSIEFPIIVLLLISSTIFATDIKGKKFTDYKNSDRLNVTSNNQQTNPLIFLKNQSPSAINLVYFGDRATFNAQNPISMTEDFEKTLVADLGVIGTSGPYDSATDNAAFAPGGIMEGIRFTHVGLGGDGTPGSAMVATGDGFFGIPTATIGPNFFSDDLDIIMLDEIFAVGLDIFDPFGAKTVNINIYGEGNILLDAMVGFPIVGGGTGTFWGVQSNQKITHIRINDPTAGLVAQLVDDVTIALANSVAISGHVLDGDGNAVPDVNVTFSNGGATVKTDVNGRYITSVAYGWHGTSTASYDWWTFVPMSYNYSTAVTTDLTDQDFTATQLPSSVFIDGHIRDKNNNGIEGVSISFDNGGPNVMSNMYGYYKAYFAYGWNGVSTVSMDGKIFTPESVTYEPLTENVLDQDYYVAGPAHLIMTGYVRDADGNGIDGAAITFSNGGATVYTYPDGLYEGSVAAGWNGTATPAKPGYVFTPAQYTYPMHLWEDQLNQDFTLFDASDPNVAVLNTFDNNSLLPTEFVIMPAYPNPFNPTTTLSYGLDGDSKVSVEIFDVSGKMVKSLLNDQRSKGWHRINWNGTNQHGTEVPAGIYLSKITANNEVKTSKLMLLK